MNPAPEVSTSNLSAAPVSLPSMSASISPFQSHSAPTSLSAITNPSSEDSDEDYDAEEYDE